MLRIVGVLMMVYVLFGGMTATTWVQIIKAVMLLFGVTFMAFMVMKQYGFSPEALFADAVHVKTVGFEAAKAAAIAAATAEEIKTIEDVYEPYLLQIGFLARTPRGRIVTEHAYKHLGIKYIAKQNSLL